MGSLFNAAFSAVEAWNQIGMMIIAAVLMVIGALLVAWDIYWRAKGTRVDAHIVAVRATGVAAVTAVTSKPVDSEPPPAPAPAPAPARESFGVAFRKSPIAGVIALVFVAMFLALPLGFAGMGLWMGGNYVMLATTGAEAQGTVLRNEQQASSKGGVSYFAIVSFRDSQGAEHEMRDKVSFFNRPSFPDGSSVEVHYDPANPAHAFIGGAAHNLALPMIFAGFGCLFPLVLFSVSRRGQRKIPAKRSAFQGEMYYPVYEYTDANGSAVRVPSDSGSNWIGDKLPGRDLTLYVRPSDPQDVTTASLLFALFGLLFLVPGTAMMFYAVSHMKFNIFFIGILAWLIAKAVLGLHKIIKPRAERETGAAFTARKREERAARTQAGRLLDEQEIRDRLRVQDHNADIATPFLALMAVLLIAGGAYIGQGVAHLCADGHAAPGRVERLDSSYGSNGTTYHSVVSFALPDGAKREFRDSIGASTPLNQPGETVSVLFDPADPSDAMIDRGLWNWALPAGLALVGILLLTLAVKVHHGVILRRAWLAA